MKNAYINKLIAFLLSLVMLSSLTVFLAGAEDSEEYVPVEWRFDESGESIYGGQRRYDRYYVKGAFYGYPKTAFYFMNRVEYEGEMCRIYGESAEPHIVSVTTSEGYSSIFVDEEGRKILDGFLDGTDCIYYLEDVSVEYTVIDPLLVTFLDKDYYSEDAELVAAQVNELSDGYIYEVTVHDRTETKAYQHGAVYVMPNGDFYYLCFGHLDNNYFDSDGFFSYRSGSVEVLKLEGAILKDVKAALLEMEPREKKTIYEEDVVYGWCDINGDPIEEDDFDFDDGRFAVNAVLVFWIFFILIGFIVPIPVLIVGLALPRSEKLGNNKSWYLIALFAAMWILAALGILAVVLI